MSFEAFEECFEILMMHCESFGEVQRYSNLETWLLILRISGNFCKLIVLELCFDIGSRFYREEFMGIDM